MKFYILFRQRLDGLVHENLHHLVDTCIKYFILDPTEFLQELLGSVAQFNVHIDKAWISTKTAFAAFMHRLEVFREISSAYSCNELISGASLSQEFSAEFHSCPVRRLEVTKWPRSPYYFVRFPPDLQLFLGYISVAHLFCQTWIC